MVVSGLDPQLPLDIDNVNFLSFWFHYFEDSFLSVCTYTSLVPHNPQSLVVVFISLKMCLICYFYVMVNNRWASLLDFSLCTVWLICIIHKKWKPWNNKKMLKIEDSEKCKCGIGKHLLKKCPTHAEHRKLLWPTHSIWGQTL